MFGLTAISSGPLRGSGSASLAVEPLKALLVTAGSGSRGIAGYVFGDMAAHRQIGLPTGAGKRCNTTAIPLEPEPGNRGVTNYCWPGDAQITTVNGGDETDHAGSITGTNYWYRAAD